MAAVRAAEVEVLFTVNDKDVDRAEKSLKVSGQRIEKNPVKVKVDAEEKGALAGIERVSEAAKKLVTRETAVTINANVARGEANIDRVKARLDYLRSIETTVDVKADIARAEGSLQRFERQVNALKSARAELVVDADTNPAKQKLSAVADYAGDAGGDAGDEMSDGIINSLTAIPIAGAIAGIAFLAARAARDGFQEGLAIDARLDRLGALTGLDEAQAQRVGLAAGEAYANNFGTSIESNMDTARLALQFNILDADATTRDAQRVVQGLSGIADALGEDVAPVARTVAVLLSSGIATSAEHAYDLLATGAREGLNRNEDLLDTLTEYPALFKRLGLSGDEALGLISQGLQAGARDSDKVADALKELQIRATDGSDASRAAYEIIGLSADEMTAKIAAGGDGAKEGLDQILDGLRAIEDPVARNAAAVGLFGTQAEDLGEALFALDLSTAVAQLDGVTGAAQAMFDRLADNDAAKMEQAQRNIEVAVQGIQGALAAAFSEPLGEFSDWISQNRGPVLQFFLDLANGALDFADTAIESTGAFVSGPLAEMITGLATAIKFFDWGADTSELSA